MAAMPRFMDNFDLANHLYSATSARVRFLEVLHQHHPDDKSERRLQQARDMFAKAEGWGRGVMAGEPLLDQEGPVGERGREAFLRLDGLILEAEEVAAFLQKTLVRCRKGLDEPGVVVMVAAACRLSQREQLFFQALLELFQRMGEQRLLAGLTARKGAMDRGVSESFALLERLREGPQWNPTRRWRLLMKAASFPGKFRLQRLELVALAARLRRNETPETYALTQEEAGQWRQAGHALFDAAQWKMLGLSPQEVALWKGEKVDNPAVVNAWLRRGFSRESSLPWRQLRFPPEEAACWKGLGVAEAEQAAVFSKELGGLEVALSWREAGFKPPEAVAQRQVGIVDPAQGRKA